MLFALEKDKKREVSHLYIGIRSTNEYLYPIQENQNYEIFRWNGKQ
jgi:hypothetical protein